jgi:hypothetical protein
VGACESAAQTSRIAELNLRVHVVLDNGSQRRFSTRVLVRPSIVALVIAAAGCGSSDSPTSPSNAAQVAGTWIYTLRLTSASGGECVGADLQNASPPNDGGRLEIMQNGATLTATVRSDLVGGACSYTGTARADSFVLNLSRCDTGTVQAGYACSNGAVRDLEYTSNPINATVSGTTATGTSVETYNVNAANTTNRVGVLTLNWSFNANRQ